MTSTPETETFRRAFDFALVNLIVALKEAQDYLGGGNDLAAIGTLIDIDERFGDFKAALRLFIQNNRRNAP
jgi:hypothetical protein